MRFYNKPIVFLFSLLALIGFGFVVPGGIFAQEPSLLFSPNHITAKTGDQFDIAVNVDTVGQKAGGVGAKILFNSTNMQVVSVTPGNIFNNYPSLAYDNLQGKIIISGVSLDISDLFSGDGLLATITFQAVSAGESKIEFIYDPGSTRDSNIAVTSGTGDILAKVNYVKVTTTGESTPFTGNEKSETEGSTGSFSLNFIFNTLEKLGIAPEDLQIFATRIMGKDIDTTEIMLSQTTKTAIDEGQPRVNKQIVKSTKSPLEKILTYLLIISLILIPTIWVIYLIYKKFRIKLK
jgi:hypothetical protein